MQQLCVIRGKLPFLSCMVSRVMLVKMNVKKRTYKNARASYKHLTRQTKKSPQFHNSITLQKKERKAPFVFM